MTTREVTMSRGRSTRISSALIGLTLPAVGMTLRAVSLNYATLRWTLETVPPAMTDRLSRERALETARRAARRVPALREEKPGETRPLISVQLARGEPSASLADALAAALGRQLAAQNRDYQEAMTEYPALMVPIVELHARGAGPFADDADRIKHRYVGA